MEIYVKISLISTFSLFSGFQVSTMILPMSQLQTQQLIASQIRSHIESLIQTYCIPVLIF